MDKLKEILDKILPSIPYDKKLHFLCGFAIALIMGFLTDPITGIGLAIAAGIAKECYDDWNKDGSWDWKDALATWIGGIAGYIVAFLVHGL